MYTFIGFYCFLWNGYIETKNNIIKINGILFMVNSQLRYGFYMCAALDKKDSMHSKCSPL